MTVSNRRRAGVLIPLFSCPSTTSWGIGDIGDLGPMAAWLAGAAQRVLQLLPINEMAAGQASPYSAISAMAIDPLYIRVQDVVDFEAMGGESSMPAGDRAALEAARSATRVDYPTVRRLKEEALQRAFDRFRTEEWERTTSRARELARFVQAEAWWLDDYSIFRALHAHGFGTPWTDWPEPLRLHDPAAVERARREHATQVLFYQYLQWLANTQWWAARRTAASHGVKLFGDLPFMVDRHSADVWARQGEFDLEATVGVPPDAFSETGQDWGMPVYRWDVMAAGNFAWLRDRARRSADLYDGYRVDHLVGFYRTYARPVGSAVPYFTPADEPQQTALGEQLLAIFRGPGSEIIAEDLGLIPDFVRASLVCLGIPGFRVFRWERFWDDEGKPFRDPADYPAISVATSGTHDTEPMAFWWETSSEDDRAKVARVRSVQQLAAGIDLTTAPFNPAVRDVLLEALFASGSDLVLIPMPDLFGWHDRINEPATVSDDNWTFRLPWPSDHLAEIPEARSRQEVVRGWTRRHDR